MRCLLTGDTKKLRVLSLSIIFGILDKVNKYIGTTSKIKWYLRLQPNPNCTWIRRSTIGKVRRKLHREVPWPRRRKRRILVKIYENLLAKLDSYFVQFILCGNLLRSLLETIGKFITIFECFNSTEKVRR